MEEASEILKGFLVTQGIEEPKAAEIATYFKQNVFKSVNEKLNLDDLNELAKELLDKYA